VGTPQGRRCGGPYSQALDGAGRNAPPQPVGAGGGRLRHTPVARGEFPAAVAEARRVRRSRCSPQAATVAARRRRRPAGGGGGGRGGRGGIGAASASPATPSPVEPPGQAATGGRGGAERQGHTPHRTFLPLLGAADGSRSAGLAPSPGGTHAGSTGGVAHGCCPLDAPGCRRRLHREAAATAAASRRRAPLVRAACPGGGGQCRLGAGRGSGGAAHGGAGLFDLARRRASVTGGAGTGRSGATDGGAANVALRDGPCAGPPAACSGVAGDGGV
ncbi:unnamed protein product, partial [Phaeothamnion confervicola]